MSAFAPLNITGGQDQKKQLIQRLMDQYQQQAARSAGLAGSASTPATAAASLPNARPFGGAGHFTSPFPNLAQSLIQRLGPGGFGHPIAGRESSPGQGQAIAPGLVQNPHAGSVLSPVSPAGPPGLSMPQAPQAPQAPGVASSNAAPQAPIDPNAPIQLGNGLVYHPSTGIVTGYQAPTSAGGGVRGAI